jgi:hypothetical protein
MLSDIVPPAQRVGVVLVIVGAAGISFTVTVVVLAVLVQPLTVTVTEYVPPIAVDAFVLLMAAVVAE